MLVRILLVCIAGAAAYAPWLAAAPRVAVPVRQRRASAVRASTLDEWLDEEGSESDLSTILLALCNGCKLVASKIATASCDSTSCFNEINMGEDDEEPEMLAIDLLAEEILFGALSQTGLVHVASCESDRVLRHLTLLPDGCYSVSFDPLDASSIIDTNFAVGTIFAVWRSPSLLNVTGRQLVAVGACTYGPRSAVCLAMADRPGVQEFLLVDGSWRSSNYYDTVRAPELTAFAATLSRLQRQRPCLRPNSALRAPSKSHLLWPPALAACSGHLLWLGAKIAC